MFLEVNKQITFAVEKLFSTLLEHVEGEDYLALSSIFNRAEADPEVAILLSQVYKSNVK
jgi:hypothetical protein